MSPRYLLRRLLQVVPAVAGIVLLAFVVIHVAPGDPVVALGGEHGDEAYYAFIRAKFGLDRPLPEQLLTYVTNVLRGDLGQSYVHGRPVAHVVGERLPATLLLMGTALALSSIIGVWLGVLAARRADRPADLAVRTAALLGHATPSFWLAQLAAITLALGTGLFPVQGITDPHQSWSGWRYALDVLHHLALPALVLAAGELALTTRLTRTGVLEGLGTDYARTARAKGLSERAVVRHALRNALLPVVTVIGGRVGMLCTGAALVEVVFAWPGLGQLMLSSILTRDIPVLLGLFVLVSLAVIAANLLTDVAYAWLDPRVRYD
ncbi:MAG TPA: ABC transporter permease [Methylomirabilota bacterium]|nr:ABC transporter permease [Methylomirabilota bacterium]